MRVNKDGTGKTNIGPRGFRQLADIKIQKYGYGMPGGCIYACIFFFSLSIYGGGCSDIMSQSLLFYKNTLNDLQVW